MTVDILLVTVNSHGHFRPLVVLGELLRLYGGADVKTHLIIPMCDEYEFDTSEILNSNLIRVHLPDELSQKACQQPGSLFEWLRANQKEMVDEICGRVAKLNVKAVLYDAFVVMGQALAETLGVKHFTVCTSPLYCYYLLSTSKVIFEPQENISSIEVPGLGKIDPHSLPTSPLLRRHFESVGQAFLRSRSVIANDSPCEPGFDVLRSEIQSSILSATGQFPKGAVHPLGYMNDFLMKMSPSEESTSVPDPVIDWLDKQAPGSVLFIALGSWCDLQPCDVVELAEGIAGSGLLFLWALRERAPPMKHHHQPGENVSKPDCQTDARGLPVDYHERTAERGMVVSWVDQPRILKHPSIKGFLTHCGWNSLTEGLSLTPVPKILLPLAGEQRMNAEIAENYWKVGKLLWTKGENGTLKLDRSDIKNRLNDTLSDQAVIESAARFFHDHNEHIRENAQKIVSTLAEEVLN